VEGWVDLSTAVKVHSPCSRLYITAAVAINTTVSSVIRIWILSHHRNDINKRYYCVWHCCPYPQTLQSIIHHAKHMSVPVTSRCSVKSCWMNNRASFWHGSFLSPIHLLLSDISNNGSSLWNFVPNYRHRKFCFSMSTVETNYQLSSTKWTLAAR